MISVQDGVAGDVATQIASDLRPRVEHSSPEKSFGAYGLKVCKCHREPLSQKTCAHLNASASLCHQQKCGAQGFLDSNCSFRALKITSTSFGEGQKGTAGRGRDRKGHDNFRHFSDNFPALLRHFRCFVHVT